MLSDSFQSLISPYYFLLRKTQINFSLDLAVYLVIAFFASLAEFLLSASIALILPQSQGNAFQNKSKLFTISQIIGNSNLLYFGIFLVFVVLVAKFYSLKFVQQKSSEYGSAISGVISLKMFSYPHFIGQSGDLITYLTRRIDEISEMYKQLFYSFSALVALLVLTVLGLYFAGLTIALVAISILIPFLILNAMTRKVIKKNSFIIEKASKDIAQYAKEIHSCRYEINSSGDLSYFSSRVEAKDHEYRNPLNCNQLLSVCSKLVTESTFFIILFFSFSYSNNHDFVFLDSQSLYLSVFLLARVLPSLQQITTFQYFRRGFQSSLDSTLNLIGYNEPYV